MKKIYCAGKFNLKKDKFLSLSDRLVNDFRAILLGDSKKLTNANSELYLSDKYHYIGPFYCEQASNGDFTSTDCNTVLNAEYNYVVNCDVYLALFDENFSVGTIVELGWAILMDKEIVILYKEEDSKYQIKSEYWFAICDALKRSNKILVRSFNNMDEAILKIRKLVNGYEI